MLSIDGVAPTLKNFETEKYPHSKLLHFFVRRPMSDASERFLVFLQGSEARNLMQRVGLFLVEGD
jgi:hypothetical protein